MIVSFEARNGSRGSEYDRLVVCRGLWVGEGVLGFKIRDATMIENQLPLLCIFVIPFKFQSARIFCRWSYESEVFLRRNSRK